jgi:cobalt-precorrin-5B (C1)-methyltransferase
MPSHHGKDLRCGFTTGAAAAAAAKAAMLCLLNDRAPQQVTIELLTGDRLTIAVHSSQRPEPHTAICTVIKDGGDDPDITHGAEIGVRVHWEAETAGRRVEIHGGPGVGMVTKPGLEIPPGHAAINSGPQQMIRRAATQAMEAHNACGTARVEIFVPRGAELAEHTLNARLGILGGISILGTTGVVRPLSHEAYVATIKAALSVARAAGLNRVVLTTGRRSERFAQECWPEYAEEGFVQIGDYFARALGMTAALGFHEVILAVFFGKAVKMAQAIPHTHARSARLTLGRLAHWAREVGGGMALSRQVAEANTARHAFDLIKAACPALIEKVGGEIINAARQFGGPHIALRALIFDFNGKVCFDSK